MSNLKQLDAAQFATRVEAGEGLILVDFFAEWCAPCRMIAPSLDALAAEYAGRVQIVKVDADAEPGIIAKYGVRGLPTLVMFEDGSPVGMRVGAHAPRELRAFIDEHAARVEAAQTRRAG